MARRITECDSFSEVAPSARATSHGAALWSLDFIFLWRKTVVRSQFPRRWQKPLFASYGLGTNITQVGLNFLRIKNVFPCCSHPALLPRRRPTNDTIPFLLPPDPFLLKLTSQYRESRRRTCSLSARITECASYSTGGTPGVSDAYGAALWSLDFMFTVALNGGQGVNFHGGGRSPYSPLNDWHMVVNKVGGATG